MIAPSSARRVRAAGRVRQAFTLLEVLVVVAILLILAGLGTFAAVSQLSKAKVNEAKLKMQAVEQACKRYYISHEATYPDNLTVLVQPPDGRPELEGGQTAITDPWGKPFSMSVVADQTGTQRVVIKTTDDQGNPLQWPDR